MIVDYVDNDQTIKFGHTNDNKATQVAIPIGGTYAHYGANGEWTVLFRRPEDSDAYVVHSSQVSHDDDYVYITITNVEVAQPGIGELQLQYSVDDVVKMKRIYKVSVQRSLVEGEDVPSPWQPWILELQRIESDAEADADRAEAAAERAEEATTRAPYIGANDNWFVWNAETEQYVDTGVKAKGEKGDNNVFIAEYGVSSFSDILSALNAGKEVVVRGQDRIYHYSARYMTGEDSIFFYSFSQGNESGKWWVKVFSNNTWQQGSVTLENATQNKATDFSVINDVKYPTTKAVQDKLDEKVDKYQSGTNLYITAEEIHLSAIDGTITANSEQIATIPYVDNVVSPIESKIPPQASATNKLADKEFVNSSIGTNTANYISNGGQPFNSVAELEAYSGTVTNNDYAFVTGTDAQGNAYYDRYKATVEGSSRTWAKEYRLNNSSFTAAQWSAISSGITSGLVAKIGTAIQPTDFATQSKAGIVKPVEANGMQTNANGFIFAAIRSLQQYTDNTNGALVIGKGTLENVKGDVVKRALQSDNGWTGSEKATARNTLGIVSGGKIILPQAQENGNIAAQTIPVPEGTATVYLFAESIDESDTRVSYRLFTLSAGGSIMLFHNGWSDSRTINFVNGNIVITDCESDNSHCLIGFIYVP